MVPRSNVVKKDFGGLKLDAYGHLCLYQAKIILVPSGLQVVPSGTQVWLIVFQFYAHINLSETVQQWVFTSNILFTHEFHLLEVVGS